MFFVGIGTYIGSFFDGNLQGKGRFEYIDGSVYEGDWRSNKKHGVGKYMEPDGIAEYIGEWRNDMKHGKGTFTQKDFCLIEGTWTSGVMTDMVKYTSLE